MSICWPYLIPVSQLFSTALLHFNGTDASTTITDVYSHTWTAGGAAAIDTAQSVFGGASVLIPGASGDFVFGPAVGGGHADFTYGTGTFTIDFRLRFSSTPASIIYLYDGRSNGVAADDRITIRKNATHKLEFFQGGGVRITGGTTLVIDTWYHVAATRSSGTTRLFLDGAQEGSNFTDATDYTGGSTRPMLGADGANNGTAGNMDGWLDELRIMKGTAAWDAAFTPPSSAYTV